MQTLHCQAAARNVTCTVLFIEICILGFFIILEAFALYIFPLFETVSRLREVQQPSTIWWDLFVYESLVHVFLLTFLFLKVREFYKIEKKRAEVRALYEE